MADQTFGVNCGFWDAINYDRTYSADDMNRPYSRLVADGVFAANDGAPSSDLQVVASGASMNITVQKGQGIFARKWFENPSSLLITVPDNTALYSRVDSLVVQVDKRTSGRVGNIVYRTGTPAQNPEPPAINTVQNVVEYRIANITVGASAASVSQAEITDLRGSSECPWVTALIQQVSTSTLWAQFQAAYAAQYDQYTSDYLAYVEAQRQAWEDFIRTLTDDLTVSTNVVSFTSVYESEDAVSEIPIGIASYAPSTDVLQVFINGLLATGGGDYTLSEDGTKILLAEELEAGQTVVMIVFKSIIGGNIESAVSLIQRLDHKIDQFTEDSGWVSLALEGAVEAWSDDMKPMVRMVGNQVYLRGSVKGVEDAETLICTLPVNSKPGADVTFLSAAVSTGGDIYPVTVKIAAASGDVTVEEVGTISTADSISLACSFLANYQNNTTMVFAYQGSVATMEDLPEDPNAGDVWTVEETGNDYLWNGAEWELFSQVITDLQIDAIIDSIS